MPAVPLPTTPIFLHAILTYLSANLQGAARRSVYEGVADIIPLNAQQRQASTQAGTPRHYYRTGFGLGILRASDLIENPRFGVWRITAQGQAILASQPNELTTDTVHDIIAKSRDPLHAQEISQDNTSAISESPQERIDAALSEISERLKKELLPRIAEQPYNFLEKLVLDLLRTLYGASPEDLQHIGQSGDQGIDGIVSLDKLGFDKIYVQAKRWQANVGGPHVQQFIGALSQKNAQKGVLITTSSFTAEAIKTAKSQAPRIVLIDGNQLCTLMIEHGVGVTRRQMQIPKIDLDYFEGED